MLLLTDRLNEGLQLRRSLGLKSCVVVALHQALTTPPNDSLIICDVALDNVSSIELLRAALAMHRTVLKIPVLCLTRDPSHFAIAQASAIGATAILPYDTGHEQLMATIRHLIGVNYVCRQDPGGAVKTNIEEAGAALGDLLDAAKRRQTISQATLDHGGNAVIAAIGQARIRAWLDIVWNYDDLTYQHSLLVAGFAAAFALKLGLSRPSQRLLSQAALLHDIGKANIPCDILNKAGRLTDAETVIMRTHPRAGYDMLVGQGGLDPRLLDVVRHHHEYVDGTGYPDALRGAQISQFVRVMTICDIYAALIEKRSYKAPMPPRRALSVLVDMGPRLDNVLVRDFHALIEEA